MASPPATHGATRTWTGLGVGNNWNTALNWSGGSVPGAGDTAVFDGTSVKPVTINVNINLSGAGGGLIVNTGYTGTITQAAGVSVTVGGVGFSQADGTFAGGTAAMTVNGPFALTGGAFTSTSGTLTVTGNFTQGAGTFAPNGGILRFAGGAATIDVGASASYGNVTFAAGAKTIAASSTMIANGLLTLTGGTVNTGTIAARGPINQASTSGSGTGTLVIDGPTDQTFTGSATAVPGAGALPNLVIDKPSGTLSLVGTIRTGRNWTYSAGLVDPGSSLVVLTAGTLSGAMPFFDLDLRGGTITGVATDTATVAGTLNLVSGVFNTGTIAARGPINQASTSGSGTGTLVIDGPTDQTFTGSATAVPGAGALPNLVIDKPSGTLSLVGTIRTGRNWTYSAGLVDPGSSLVVLTAGTLSGAMPFFDLDLRGGTITGVATDTATVAGTLNLVSGVFNTGTIAARGPINQASTSGSGTGTLVIDGPTDQTFTGSATAVPGAGALPNLVIDKPSGTLSLVGTIRTGRNWTYSAGLVDPGSSLVVLTAGTLSGAMPFFDLDLRGGTITGVATDTATVAGTLNLVSGVFNTGTIAARGPINQASTSGSGTGTLVIDGPTDQTFTGSATAVPGAGALPNLVIDKPSGTLSLVGTIRTGRNWTYSAGLVDPGSSLVVLTAGTLTSDGMAFNDLTVFGGTVTLGNGLTVDTDLTVASGVLDTGPAANAPLDVGGDLLVSGTLRGRASVIAIAGDVTINGTFTPATSSVILDGLAGQTIGGTGTIVFFDLTIDDAAGAALGSAVSVTGTLALNSGPFDISGQSLTIRSPIGGTPDNLSADALSTIVVNGAAPGIVLPASVSTLGTLTINTPAGVSMLADLTIEGILGLAASNLDAGSSTVTIGPAGSVVRGTGWVIGQLQKPVAVGSAVAVSFEVGDASVYAPAAVTFDSVAIGGLLTTSTTSGDHPALASSPIFPPMSVNRYWTLTNAGIAFGTYDMTLTWVPADVDLAAATAAFIVGKLDGATWTTPTITPPTPTSITATGMTGFSDFAVGDPPTADLAILKVASPDPALAGAALVYTLTITNGGPADADSVSLVDVLPVELTGVTYCTGSGCDPTGGTAWSSPLDMGTLAAGETVIVRIGASVPADTTDGTTLVNTATVSSATTEIDPSDDSVTISTTVSATADLAITLTGPATATAGEPAGFDYVLTVTNGGPANQVGGFTVTDRLPDGLTFRPAGSDPACNASGQDVTCLHVAGLSIDENVSFSVHVFLVQTAPVGSALSNSASVTSDGTTDPDPSNDTSVVLVTAITGAIPVPPAPDTAFGSMTATFDAAQVGISAVLVLLVGAGLIAGAYMVVRKPD